MATQNQEKTQNPKETIIQKVSFWENIQNIAIAIAMLLGFSGRNQGFNSRNTGEGSGGLSKFLEWIQNNLPHEFTDEDEAWANMIISACPNKIALQVERNFREKAMNDPKKYDLGIYRQRLMANRKEFNDEARKPSLKNEQDARFLYDQIIQRDPCRDFLEELIDEVAKGGSDEEIYERQKKIAELGNYLVKTGGIRKGILWLRNHKFQIIGWIIFAILLIAYLFTIIFQ